MLNVNTLCDKTTINTPLTFYKGNLKVSCHLCTSLFTEALGTRVYVLLQESTYTPVLRFYQTIRGELRTDERNRHRE